MKIYVKLDTNNVVIGWATSEIFGSIEVETNIDVTCTDITYTYKLENSQLVKLTEEEKAEYQQIDNCLDDIKINKILESKQLLAKWLEENPLYSTIHNSNGEYYNITQDKQTQLTQMITLYGLSVQNNIEFHPTWNSTGSECEEWTIEELTQLTFEITQYVLPKVKKQQQYETQIKLMNTVEEVESLVIDYGTVTQALM